MCVIAPGIDMYNIPQKFYILFEECCTFAKRQEASNGKRHSL